MYSFSPSVLITGPIKAGAGAAKMRPIEDPNTKDQQNYDSYITVPQCHTDTTELLQSFIFFPLLQFDLILITFGLFIVNLDHSPCSAPPTEGVWWSQHNSDINSGEVTMRVL